MTDDMKKTIGSLFYEDGLKKDDLIKLFNLRPKTLNKILAEVRSMFVKGS